MAITNYLEQLIKHYHSGVKIPLNRYETGWDEQVWIGLAVTQILVEMLELAHKNPADLPVFIANRIHQIDSSLDANDPHQNLPYLLQLQILVKLSEVLSE
jgi:hypothetical protein